MVDNDESNGNNSDSNSNDEFVSWIFLNKYMYDFFNYLG